MASVWVIADMGGSRCDDLRRAVDGGEQKLHLPACGTLRLSGQKATRAVFWNQRKGFGEGGGVHGIMQCKNMTGVGGEDRNRTWI